MPKLSIDRAGHRWGISTSLVATLPLRGDMVILSAECQLQNPIVSHNLGIRNKARSIQVATRDLLTTYGSLGMVLAGAKRCESLHGLGQLPPV
jgi:hypothetical protein